MIISFVSTLEEAVKGPEVVFNQMYDEPRKEATRRANKHKLLHVDDFLTLPCLNTDCVWVRYMSIFHRSKPLMQLPACDRNAHCFVCSESEQGLLDMSSVRLTEDFLVYLK